ncbi:hypothetical protein V8E53_006419 [Lactarius tabidus]
MLPNLKHLMFQGISAYLECLVAQIRAPSLERLDVKLFNQVAFALPHLSFFTNNTERLKLPKAKLIFGRDAVSVISDQHNPRQYINMTVTCKQLDWQIDCAAQVCSALMPVLSVVNELTVDFYQPVMPTQWQNGEIDGTTWHELLRPFIDVKTLYICGGVLEELSRALQVDEIGSDPGFLPSLQAFKYPREVGHANNLFSSFLDARQVAGRTVPFVLSTMRHTILSPLVIPTSPPSPGPQAPVLPTAWDS